MPLELDVGDGEESKSLESLAIYSVAIVRIAGNACLFEHCKLQGKSATRRGRRALLLGSPNTPRFEKSSPQFVSEEASHSLRDLKQGSKCNSNLFNGVA